MTRSLLFLILSGLLFSWSCGADEDSGEEENVEVAASDEEESDEQEDDEAEEEDADDDLGSDEGELSVESEELILDEDTRARVAPEQRGLAHILIRYRGADRAEGVTRTKEAAEALARQALERVQGDEEFGAVAAELSDDGANKEHGGVMGLLEPGLLPEPIDDALFAMEVGEVRGPVESALGYHVLTRTE